MKKKRSCMFSQTSVMCSKSISDIKYRFEYEENKLSNIIEMISFKPAGATLCILLMQHIW